MKLKVQKSQEIWQSDDGRVAIYQVMAQDGDVYKTRSRAIGESNPGSEFDVEVRQETNRFGQEEQWVRQEPKPSLKQQALIKDTASIERQVALKAAVDFAATREQMKASDTIMLAQEFDKFLKEGHHTSVVAPKD